MSKHGKGEALRARGVEDATDRVSSVSNSETGVRSDGTGDGDINFRDGGTLGARSIPLAILTGGILAQLIRRIEKQLGEARECVEWYERQIVELEEELQDLRGLQERASTED